MKIAIIGCGQMGGYYTDILANKLGVPREHIVAHDVDDEKQRALVQKFGVMPATTAYPAADAAIVAVNTPAHASVITGLINAGVKHILCEKPLGFTPQDVERIEKLGGDRVYTALVINFSPALPFLRDLMRESGCEPLELHATWGKPRPLDKNPRPSAGDVEDETVHPIAFGLRLFPDGCRAVGVSARVGWLPFVDEKVQAAAHESDSSFPLSPNHATNVSLEVATRTTPVPFDVRTSFLLATQTRQVGGTLGTPARPRFLFQIDFDQQGEDVLTLVDIAGKSSVQHRFKADKLREVASAFLTQARRSRFVPSELAPTIEAAFLVRISEAILASARNAGKQQYVVQ